MGCSVMRKSEGYEYPAGLSYGGMMGTDGIVLLVGVCVCFSL